VVLSKIILGRKMEGEMGMTCRTYRRNEKFIKYLVRKPEGRN
jgi:hypothetical protein